MIDAQKLQKITTFVFDIDGVMTDGSVHVLETGEHYRTFYIRDGYALERAIQAGYHICVITGGKHEGVRKRLQNLKIQDVFMGSGGKSKKFTHNGWKILVFRRMKFYIWAMIFPIIR
jgi:3-deoxy-D-manno-octulosonate 8-phosphate phosphatase (KDO 8-P phosphatase)